MRDIITKNKGRGPFGREATLDELEIGDVIQLGRNGVAVLIFDGSDIGNGHPVVNIGRHLVKRHPIGCNQGNVCIGKYRLLVGISVCFFIKSVEVFGFSVIFKIL